MQTLQADYFGTYRHLRLSRDAKGVLLAEFHSDGGPYIMNAQGHTEFVDAFHRIGQDRANKIVIMTGAGGNFSRVVVIRRCRRSGHLEQNSRRRPADFGEHCEHPSSGDRGRRGTRPYPLRLRAPR
jgi:enoyl-CoA hydratase/carnithine racemase